MTATMQMKTTLLGKPVLAVRVFRIFALVLMFVSWRPLHELVRDLGSPKRSAVQRHPPRRMSRAVHLLLRVGNRRPRCMIGAYFRAASRAGRRRQHRHRAARKGRRPDGSRMGRIERHGPWPTPGKGQHKEMTRYERVWEPRHRFSGSVI